MKLSEKGYLKIGNRIVGWLENGVAKVTFDPDKIEFDQDDFEGAVVLTVEEAKGLLEISRDYRMYLFEHCRIPLSLSVNEAFTALRERIEQAEGKR